MQIPVVNKFFGCVELRAATLGIGWGYGIVLTISFVGFLISLTSRHVNGGGSIATAIFSIIAIAFCVILVLGVNRDNASYVKMGWYFLIIHAFLLAITCLVSLLSVGLVVLLVYLPLSFYCALTVRSYYLQMTGQTTAPGGV